MTPLSAAMLTGGRIDIAGLLLCRRSTEVVLWDFPRAVSACLLGADFTTPGATGAFMETIACVG